MSPDGRTVRDRMAEILAFYDVREDELDELVEIARTSWWDNATAGEYVGAKDSDGLGAWCRRHGVGRRYGAYADDVVNAKAAMVGQGWRAGRHG